MVIKKLFFWLLAFSFWLLAAPPVKAQNFSLSLTPSLLEVVIKPGKVVSQTYEIFNLSDKDTRVTAALVPFRAGDQQGNLELLTDKAGLDKSLNWFTLTQPDRQFDGPFVIKAAEKLKLSLKIKVPADAFPQDYYYTLLIRHEPEILTTGQTRTVNLAGLGSNLLLAVVLPEENIPSLAIEDFRLTSPLLPGKILDSSVYPRFQAVVKNPGRHFAKMAGRITVKDNRGRTVETLTLQPQNVLAEASRPALCQENSQCRLSRTLFPGRYQAVLSLGESSQTITFYVLPLRLSLIAGILGLILLGLSQLWRRYKNLKKL